MSPSSRHRFAPVLIGRERECVAIDALLQGARDGTCSTLVLRGEAGVGKTRLCGEAEERAGGMLVLGAQGVESESHLPFAGLLQLLRPALGDIACLPPVQRRALEGALSLGPPGDANPFAVYAATMTLLAAASESLPLLAVVDDLQWLDRSSVDAVLFAARRLEHDCVAFVVALRPDDGEQPDLRGIPIVDVGGLNVCEGAALLESIAPHTVSASVARRLTQETAGNPLALCQLSAELTADQLAGYAHIDDPLPVTIGIRDAFSRRVRNLDESTRTALLVVAAGGDRLMTAEAALHTLGGEAAALDSHETEGLVEVRDGRVCFHHPLVRAAVYSSATHAERRHAHAALAEVLAVEPDRRAWHLAAAATGLDENVAAELDRAADRAEARSGLHEAAHAFERAARLSPNAERRAGRLLRAALRYRLAGRPRRAAALCAEAQSITTDATLRAEIVRLRGHIDIWSSSPEVGYATLLAEVGRLVDAPPEARAAILSEAALPLIMTGDMGRAVTVARQACALMSGRDDTVALAAKVSLAASLVLHGETAEGALLVDDCVEQTGQAAADHGSWTLLKTPFVAYSLILLEDYGRAERLLSDAIRSARERGAAGLLPVALGHLAQVSFHTGAWPLAEAHALEGLRLAEETDQPTQRPYTLSTLARLAAARGSVEECHHYAEEATAGWGQNSAAIQFFVSTALGLLHLGRGEHGAAVDALLATIGVIERGEVGEPWLVAWLPDLVEAEIRVGDTGAATRTLAILEKQAEQTGRTSALAAAARCRGLLAGDEFEDSFREALRLHDLVPTPFERGRTLLCYGERLRRAKRKRVAIDVLRQALGIFDKLGALCWSDSAGRELRAGGDRVPGRRRSAIGELTPQELQIASVVAAGATNREAAASLFLSPKTVENHLSRIYAKLNLRTRTDLANHLRLSP